ncbi:MAG: alpha/beta hydrolase [Acholeplasmataceae bacterium]
MIHQYIKKEDKNTLILLHGTGGNESDLIPIASFIDSKASLLGIRGNVLESGMPRFFKRLAFGVFDQESLKQESHTLYHFINECAKTYDFDLNEVTVIGYSNGANILAYMLMHFPLHIKKAMMLHPMVPSRALPTVKNHITKSLITAGQHDAMVPMEQSLELKKIFDEMSLNTELKTFDSGHQLTQDELTYLKSWYEKRA